MLVYIVFLFVVRFGRRGFGVEVFVWYGGSVLGVVYVGGRGGLRVFFGFVGVFVDVLGFFLVGVSVVFRFFYY